MTLYEVMLFDDVAFAPSYPEATNSSSTTCSLHFGVAGSYGIYGLKVTTNEAWQDMTIKATFKSASGCTEALMEDGIIKVPPSATAKDTKSNPAGVITFVGVDPKNSVRRISAKLLFHVTEGGCVEGDDTPQDPDAWAEYIKMVDEKLEEFLKTAGDEIASKIPVATSSKAGIVKAIEKTEEYTEEVAADPEGNLFTKPGGQGSFNINTATPTFTEAEQRENINTGETIPVLFGKIKKFFADLKTVAFTGKYSDLTGQPQALKNPNALTFKGGATGTYDGSSPVEITIPSGGGSGTSAGFGTPTATANSLEPGESATVQVEASGPDTAKIFAFTFGIPKGQNGEPGKTPQKGTDYWTTEEQQQITNDAATAAAKKVPTATAEQAGVVKARPIEEQGNMTPASILPDGTLMVPTGGGSGGSINPVLLATLIGDGESIELTQDVELTDGLYVFGACIPPNTPDDNKEQTIYGQIGNTGIYSVGVRTAGLLSRSSVTQTLCVYTLFIKDSKMYVCGTVNTSSNNTNASFLKDGKEIVKNKIALYSQNSKPVPSGVYAMLWRLS